MGATLVQEDENGVERPITYVSKQLNGNQLSWPVIEREGFGVMYAIKKLHPYLYGAEFTIYTDHKPLKNLFVRLVDSAVDWDELNPRISAQVQKRNRDRLPLRLGSTSQYNRPLADTFHTRRRLQRAEDEDEDYTPPKLVNSDRAEAPITRSRGLKRQRPPEFAVGPTEKRLHCHNKRSLPDDVFEENPPPKRYRGTMNLRSHKPSRNDQMDMQMDAVAFVYAHYNW